MKIILDCPVPAMLAYGGTQVQIEQTRLALQALGIEVEFLRWWDRSQRGDLIHYFGTPSNSFLALAKDAAWPVVVTNLFTETCNRSDLRLKLQGGVVQMALKVPLAGQVKNQLNWAVYQQAAHNVVGLTCEKNVLETVYRVPAERISIVPLGLSENFLKPGAPPRKQPHLICTGTVTGRKFFVELAQMARDAGVPVLFVGKPHHPEDPYWLRFKALIDDRRVLYRPHTDSQEEMIELLKSARGFVLMSRFENWCLSAHEAVACGLPLLVSDQKWSRERFGSQTSYFKTIGYSSENTRRLKHFYDTAGSLPAPSIHLHSWLEAAEKLKAVYLKVLARKPES